MKIAPIPGIGTQRALCMTPIRVAAGLKTMAAQRGAWQRNKIGVPVDQCGKRADFLIDDVPTCRAHADAAALAHVIEAQRPRTDAEEIARPRCGCPQEVVRRVIKDHGTCAMGGCPYGGDI